MREELGNKLSKEFNFYRDWFTDRDCSIPIDCGDGWFDLIYEMSQKIQATNPSEDFHILYIKEKFGALRVVVVSSINDNVDDIIKEVEQKSAITCEECGKPGSMREYHKWLMVRCDDCYEKILARTK